MEDSVRKNKFVPKLCAFVVWMILINVGVHKWRIGLEESRRDNLLRIEMPNGLNTGAPRYDHSTGENLSEYLQHIPYSPDRRTVLVCGMSQMYAINERKAGDKTISEWLDDMLAPKGTRVFGLAAPNLCNEEALLMLLASVPRDGSKPSAFIYGLCFDKFRNLDLRPGLQRILEQDPALRRSWGAIAEEHVGKYPNASSKMQASLKKVNDALTKEDKSFEVGLRNTISRSLPLVEARQPLNAWGQLQLFRLRNAVFRISATSKRPQIASRYILNQDFLQLLIEVAKGASILPILYIVPLNPQAENPYIAKEYVEFKSWAATVANRMGIPFENLENIVPADEWGEFMGGPDFKHFRGEGHRRTAEEIVARFSRYLAAQQEPIVP